MQKDLDLVAGVVRRLWQEEQGQDLVEYGLLLVLLALIAAASMQTIGSTIASIFTNGSTALNTAS